ncbi:GspH/FimT family pseudopilin [Pseudomonas sp. MAP12]|uniref:GspH/FimT family pseudopilin n=1 Tax=Geopseudomonas aromaticivorans TaxID=2849492 RepID=A0ABS6MS30_9GAMM|nr:GspH/FimT family pseudopilin [Pseudomonas aromaticivorans]MBV2131596.1 GspH/FimT family pseudopilin [Pseudomonas aromaticivorans]
MCVAGSEARGFTLMELLVVLVIAGLAASLIGPGFQRMLPGVGLETEARTLAAMLRHARSQAILSGQPVSIGEDAESGGLRLSYREAPYIPRKGIEVKLEGGPASGDLGSGAAQILFFPPGDSSGGSLTLKMGDDKSRVIQVDWLSGRVLRTTEEAQAQLKMEREKVEKARARDKERRRDRTPEMFNEEY